MPRRTRRIKTAIALSIPLAITTVVGLGLTSCIATVPRHGSIEQSTRLDAFPSVGLAVRGRVEIHWDEHSIPFIHAQRADDVPYALGLVHAHLRLAQMEVIRHASQGRLSEMGGPLLGDLDTTIRTLDLARAVPEMARTLPPETRRWIERYVEGINDYQSRVTGRSADYRTLGFEPEPWTVEDVLTFGRLASADINWGRWLALLPKRELRGYDEYLDRLHAFNDRGVPSFSPGEPTPLAMFDAMTKSGSNCFVVAGGKSASGSAMLAADPHLGLPQPNAWCAVAYRSPEGSAIGLTLPLLPFILIGRNEDIAWGGTNMQNLASTLYDVSDETLTEREEHLPTRWWFDRTATIRESSLGPVLSDAFLFDSVTDKPAALVWNGHAPSDESSTFLRVAKAKSWPEFREAFATYGAGGQNFLYADRAGNIGQLLATRVHPVAGRIGIDVPVDPNDPANAWGPGIPSTELPASYNPPEGRLVSANNTPASTDPPLLFQGNANDRVVRMQTVLDTLDRATADDLARLQRDVYSAASARAAAALAQAVAGIDLDDRTARMVESVRAWDGAYETDSAGAASYQAWLRQIIDDLYEPVFDTKLLATLRSAPYVHDFVLEDVRADRFAAVDLALAARRAARKLEQGTTWGDLHRYRARHPLGGIPVLGRSYRFGEYPSPGTLTTVYKAAHPATGQTHGVTFGANARFVTDLADPDANTVVLLGGQDGFLGSEHLTDQIPLWYAGKSVPLPLSEHAQRARSVRSHVLEP